MTKFLLYVGGSINFILSFTYIHFLILIITVGFMLYLMSRRSPIYLLDFVCYRPPDSSRLPMSMFLEHITIPGSFDTESIQFQRKILEKSGFGPETCISLPLTEVPANTSLSCTIEEAQTVILTVVRDLLKKTNVNPKSIDFLILNSSMFSSTPSLTAMIMNKFQMRSNVRSFNLSGMGCSAGIISVSLARDLMRVHQNSLALVVCTEMLSLNWYTGRNRSMLLTNCIFRSGGAAILMSSRDQDKKSAKYVLQHIVRTNNASNDRSYNCVYQDVDLEGKVGVSLSKDILHVAGDILKVNFAGLGPLVLPFSEQFRYVLSVLRWKFWRPAVNVGSYVPNFKRVFEHICIHAGGRGVIEAIEEKLGLNPGDVEASKMTLHRFGNTSSSSIWYELCYIEAKGKMKRGDRVWQVAFGSGFKCNSCVWKCISDVDPQTQNVWMDRIHLYPVDILDVIKID